MNNDEKTRTYADLPKEIIMIKVLTAAVALAALASLANAAEPTKMTDTALDQVVAGCGCVPEKGNNGWGNGMDPTNAGSFSGATEPSKSCNCSTDGSINTNPTTSTGR